MPMTLAVPLDLPDVRVLTHRMLEDGRVLIEVESTLQTTRCHRCGREIDRFHGFDRPIRLRHLPVFGRRVVVEIRPKRYRCPHCEGGPTTTQRCAWYDPNRPHTTAFEQDVLKRLIHSTVAECHRLNANRPPERAIPTAALRPLLRREWRSLNPDQQGKIIELFEQTPILARAYVLRTLLTAIFESAPDRATAQSRLRLWVKQVKASGLHSFDPFLNTWHRWQDKILNSFDGRQTSGFVEGLNNKLKLLKRRCFGLDDPTALFRRLWLDIEGPRLWA